MDELSIEYHFEKDFSYLEIVVHYVINRLDSSEQESFFEEVKQLPGPLGEKAMTLANALVQRGKQEGWQEGWQEGRQEGRFTERLEVARKLIQDDYDNPTIARLTGLSNNDISNLRKRTDG